MNTLFPRALGTFAACQVRTIGAPTGLIAAFGFVSFTRLDVGDYRLVHERIRLNVEAIPLILQITNTGTPNTNASIQIEVESDTQFRMRGNTLPVAGAIDFNFYAIIRRWQ